MGRLIDADALIEKLKRTSAFEYVRNSADKNVFEIIAEEPTAYDVEKVVAELETMEEKAIKVKNITVSSYACGMMQKAIDIVKRGGVE